MEKAITKIPFELHLTSLNIENRKIDEFGLLCQKLGGKPLLIELPQGECIQQPMFVKNLFAEKLEILFQNIEKLANKFRTANFKIKRIKIETDEKYSELFNQTKETYFEWHGKVRLSNPEKILELCEKHKSNLSKNALKNSENFRFVTLREFYSKKSYHQRLLKLKEDLQINEIEIFKESSEFCIYDNNQFLDKGWLPS